MPIYFQRVNGRYASIVKWMVSQSMAHLVVNLNHLTDHLPARAKGISNNIFEEQLAVSRAFKDYVSTLEPSYAYDRDFFVTFTRSNHNSYASTSLLTNEEQRIGAIHTAYLSFFERGSYSDYVQFMLKDRRNHLIVNLNDLRKEIPARASALLMNAPDEKLAFSRALKAHVSKIDPSFSKIGTEFRIGFEGFAISRSMTPFILPVAEQTIRNIQSEYLNFFDSEVCVHITHRELLSFRRIFIF